MRQESKRIFGKAPLALFTASVMALGFASGCASDGASTESASPVWPSSVVAKVEIKNPSNFARADEPVFISFHDLGLNSAQALTLSVEGVEVASEAVDQDLDGQVDGILAMVSLEAAQTVQATISSGGADSAAQVKRTQAEISHKTGGKWVPHTRYPNTDLKEYVGGSFKNVETLAPPSHYTDHSNWIRYEGPGIESDKVGYRIYLDWRNGFDIFGKLTAEPALQLVGQDGYESYHHMQPWGMDILKVGKSVGAGGFALWANEKVELVSDVKQRTANIIANGNLQSGFVIDYDDWKTSKGIVDLEAKFSMQAGSRLAKVDLELSDSVGPLAIGVVKHKNTEFIRGNVEITGKAYSYIASWGNQSLDKSPLGMAVFFKKEHLSEVVVDEKNYLAVVKTKGNPTADFPKGQELEYYFASVWAPESGIKTKEEFEAYLKQEAERLTQPARLRLKTSRSTAAKVAPLDAQQALTWSVLLADSEIKRKGDTYKYSGWDVHRQRPPKFEYDIIGLYPASLHRLSKLSGNPEHKAMIEKVTATFITDEGKIKRYKESNYNIDNVAPGMAVLALYQETGKAKYKKAADQLRHQLEKHPKTSEGAFWHKKKYTHQLWLDGVYMGMPFLANYSAMFENGHSLEEVVKEFKLTRKYLRDAETGLYHHGWDEAKQQSWADPKTGLSPEYWARGIGWLAMALVDVLDVIPESQPELRKPLLEMSEELAEAVVKFQDAETGVWWQVMEKANAPGNYLESSASAMFTYFLAASVDKGYISSSYKEAAIKAYKGLIDEFVLVHADGTISMTNQCYVAGLGFGRDGSYEYYMSEPVWKNDPKGNGPFILAGIAIHDLLSK